MAPQTLKKNCKKCGKAFLTYETDKLFCTSDCEGHFKYNEHFGYEDKHKLNETNCEQCGDLLSIRGCIKMKFCNEICKKAYDKEARAKKSAENFAKPRKHGRRLPYEVLNKIAERKRVFEDHDWMYRNNMTHKETINKVDVYISNEDYKKLLETVDFLPVFHYPYHHATNPGELGKIGFESGFTIYFHLKKSAVKSAVIINLLEEICAIGTHLPEVGMGKLKQVLKFLKENT